jgi:hypothetical protein
MTTLKALETSLYWQRVVYQQSKDPKQKERVKAAIAKLEAQIASHPETTSCNA